MLKGAVAQPKRQTLELFDCFRNLAIFDITHQVMHFRTENHQFTYYIDQLIQLLCGNSYVPILF